jgi:hypothetical protein
MAGTRSFTDAKEPPRIVGRELVEFALGCHSQRQLLARSFDEHSNAPDALGDLAWRVRMQAGVVGDGGDRRGAGTNRNEDGDSWAGAGIPARGVGQAEGRFGSRGPVPLDPVAAQHDPQPLTDPQVNCLAAVRLGHRYFTAGRGGAWLRTSAARSHTCPVPLTALVPAVHRGTAACKGGQRCNGDHHPDGCHTTLTHTTMTCVVSHRFRASARFDKVVSHIHEP